ncbi:hypothetical protein DEO72_LG3g622 [Vigna unguiculata]|uniref:Uncharacterized protein n=1 Tax=Vigna unguiculata TaxID=3917 RepID=A0A4D6LBZ6_VIGUN|nr:hypothetical protein DEO72_LG3g622 [Vigna unguiculata]
MAPGDAGRTARQKTPKTVAVATKRKWRLAAQNGAPSGLLGFCPAALWRSGMCLVGGMSEEFVSGGPHAERERFSSPEERRVCVSRSERGVRMMGERVREAGLQAG